MKTTTEIFKFFGSKLTSYDNENLDYRIYEDYTYDSNDIFVTYPVGGLLIPGEHIFCDSYAFYERIIDIIKEGNTIYIEFDIWEEIQDKLISELLNTIENG